MKYCWRSFIFITFFSFITGVIIEILNKINGIGIIIFCLIIIAIYTVSIYFRLLEEGK